MLEISARQTGKTSRLLDSVHTQISFARLSGKFCDLYIAGREPEHAVLLKERYLTTYGNKYASSLFFVTAKNIPEDTFTAMKLDRVCRVFYDDFDNYIEDIVIDNRCYYTGTPSRLRTTEQFVKDPLFSLIKEHEGRVTAHMWTDETEADGGNYKGLI